MMDSPLEIPGPSDCSHMWEDPLSFFLQATQEYGDLVRFNDDSHEIYLVNHPDYIRYVLQDNYRNFLRNEDSLKLLVGEGLGVSEGEFWLRQRRIMQPSFHRQRIEAMLPIMTAVTATFLERLQTASLANQEIDVLAEMTELTFALSAKTMFSADIQEVQVFTKLIITSLEYLRYQDTQNQDENTLSPEQLAFQDGVDNLNRIVYGIIAERRNNGEDRDDLLSMLLQAKDDITGEGMSDKQIRDEVVAILIGGQSTTAIALTWTWYALASHPDIERKFRAEIGAALGDRSLAFDDLPKLRYTRMLIDETLRLYPPAWVTSRRSVMGDKIGKYDIPAGSEIYVSPYVIHRHPGFWEDPESFDPERFSPERSAGRRPFAYLPFGGGPHICIGNNFALMAMQVVLAMMAQTFELHKAWENPIKPEVQFLLVPQDQLMMNLRQL